jgi:hypothetical protein
VFEFIAGLHPLIVFELVAIFLPYQHKLLGLPAYQNSQHVHAHKGPVFSSIFSWT